MIISFIWITGALFTAGLLESADDRFITRALFALSVTALWPFLIGLQVRALLEG